jgi:hypothetical protein
MDSVVTLCGVFAVVIEHEEVLIPTLCVVTIALINVLSVPNVVIDHVQLVPTHPYQTQKYLSNVIGYKYW